MRNDSHSQVFVGAFGTDPAVVSSAPGRVNLIGEHTDYHEGFVLPTVLPQRTTVSFSSRTDRRVRAVSDAMRDGVREFTIGGESKDGTWLDYIGGVTAAIAATGSAPSGFDAAITSTLPAGGGVSSSAALTVALLRALRDANVLGVDDLQIARLAQRAETDFVGAPVGIMDPIACSLGREREALPIDTRSLDVERIPLPPAAGLIVIDSGVTHTHASGAYQLRRDESFAAAEALGVRWLRDADAVSDWPAMDPVLRRRAWHVVTENARVLEAASALRDRDLARLGRLLTTSHASQRDDYETTTPEIDALVEIAERDPRVYGARLTGGGFGGSVVMLVAADAADAAARRIFAEYQRVIGEEGAILLPSAVTPNQEASRCG